MESKLSDYRWKATRLYRLINRIADPYRAICHQIVSENWELFTKVQGSTHNHQNWPGGYLDHISEVMYWAHEFYQFIAYDLYYRRPLNFTLSDALLSLFLHDFEKPWKYEIGPDGELRHKPGLETKESHQQLRLQKMTEYGLVVPDYIQHAMKYTEGELNDYSSKRRVMSELAAFCHMCDVCSARLFHDYPLANPAIDLEERRITNIKYSV